MNPIEQAFAKITALLRNAEDRTFDALLQALGHICNLFEQQECWNYLKAAGYESDKPSDALAEMEALILGGHPLHEAPHVLLGSIDLPQVANLAAPFAISNPNGIALWRLRPRRILLWTVPWLVLLR